MSLVDRWLVRPPAGVAVATSATLPKPACISATPGVASPLRHGATMAPAASRSSMLSQVVASDLRQERPQNSRALNAMSQMSQRAASAACGEAEEERAAIVEIGGGVSRNWAEGFARLHPDRPPADVPLRRWQTFVDDCGRFLDHGWAEKAAALSWGPYDLFGCDRDQPFARIDQAGLLWLLNGCTLIDLSENTATIETKTGRRQTWRRKSAVDPWRILAWEIIQ
jgi:hypothetical protein